PSTPRARADLAEAHAMPHAPPELRAEPVPIGDTFGRSSPLAPARPADAPAGNNSPSAHDPLRGGEPGGPASSHGAAAPLGGPPPRAKDAADALGGPRSSVHG